MVDEDIIFEKTNQIKACLKRIRETTNDNPDTLDDIDVQDIYVLNLQRAVQSAIDLASHIVSDENLGLPSEIRENFVLLEKANIINKEQSIKLQKMVGFRNVAVHDYTTIDVEILKSVLKNNLVDLEDFYSTVLKRFVKPSNPPR